MRDSELLARIRESLAKKSPKVGNVLFIAIDGHGGSGKSTFAGLLSEVLNAEVIRQDDFASWDNPLNWWPIIIERVFEPIMAGATNISYPRSKWWPNHKPEPVIDKPVTPIMILEGVSSSRREFRKYISMAIFIDTPEDVCFRRGTERDLATGKTQKEVEAEWKNWLKEEDEYFARDNPKSYADVVIDGLKPFTLNS
ncbi:MAG: hypothetical protein KGI41_01635 [Patescibacteria group bacterium]|nr:hypothetical protein [Patescibacteria group bacterium]MDE1965928.1 hypothetical protein [Patescibacteria group bacterium]